MRTGPSTFISLFRNKYIVTSQKEKNISLTNVCFLITMIIVPGFDVLITSAMSQFPIWYASVGVKIRVVEFQSTPNQRLYSNPLAWQLDCVLQSTGKKPGFTNKHGMKILSHKNMLGDSQYAIVCNGNISRKTNHRLFMFPMIDVLYIEQNTHFHVFGGCLPRWKLAWSWLSHWSREYRNDF